MPDSDEGSAPRKRQRQQEDGRQSNDADAEEVAIKNGSSHHDDGVETGNSNGAASMDAKAKAILAHEALYLSALPGAERYSKSFMHRDNLCLVRVTPHSNFVVTASIDGHVKFWKKHDVGIEFAKHYKAHLAAVTALEVSADGSLAATLGEDGSAKVFDVVNFDLINMLKLGYTPRACCWVHRRGRAESVLAISEQGSNTIRLYSGRGDGKPLVEITSIHRLPVHLLAYNEAYDCIVSADVGGMVEYWSPDEPWELPKNKGLWEYKSQTDLFEFKKSKSTPTSLTFSPDFSRFSTVSTRDRQVRVFHFATGKLLHRFDESLEAIEAAQSEGRAAAAAAKTSDKADPQSKRAGGGGGGGGGRNGGGAAMDDMEFGRRLALERELDRSAEGAETSALQAVTSGAAANAVFDASGNFLIYGSLYGIKIVNLATKAMSVLLGKDETVRFLNLSLFQNVEGRKVYRNLALAASENPILKEQAANDPTLFCTAYKRARFYMFTRHEPDADPRSKNGAERDVFNEKPTREEQTIASLQPGKGKAGGGAASSVASSATLHTTMGDIQLRLFADLVPKTVENFVGLARKGYYDGVIFHRVIKKFMLQTGDPLGDGTGGESLWGGEFEDEFRKELRHDRPYTLSMANAGPNTNGSQFFITTVPTPHLDNKHTVFGRAVSGLDVVHAIENARTDRFDKPRDDIRIINVSLD